MGGYGRHGSSVQLCQVHYSIVFATTVFFFAIIREFPSTHSIIVLTENTCIYLATHLS